MTEKSNIKINELFGQIDEFEKTIINLQSNLKSLKEKLARNKEKFGEDMSKWPIDKLEK